MIRSYLLFQHKFRWVIVALLFFITIVNYIDRSAIAYAMEDIGLAFQFSKEQEGMILGAFGLGYMLTTLLGGIAVDRFGAKKILLIAALIWSLSSGMMGFVNGFLFVYLLRVTLGLAEGPNFPAMTRAISDWLPKEECSFALSSSLIAVPLALAIGAPIVSELIVHIGWRTMFYFLGALGILWLPLWFWLFSDFPEQNNRVSQDEIKLIHGDEKIDEIKVQEQRRHVPGLWKFLLTNPTLLVNNIAFFVFGYFLFFFMTWLPSYLEQVYQLNLIQVGWFSVMPWLLAALLLWTTGYLSDVIFRKTNCLRLSRSYPIWISQLLAALSILPILFYHSLTVSMISITLAVAFSMSANAAYYAVNVDIAKERAGTALGIMEVGFSLSGFLAPVITGYVITLFGGYHAAFLLLVILGLISVCLVFLFHRPNTAY